MAVNIRRRAVPASYFRWDIELVGIMNGVNQVFAVPGEKFVQGGNIGIRVHSNGQRLQSGVGNDYVASESGGLGTGYDQVILVRPPKNGERVTADYIAAP